MKTYSVILLFLITACSAEKESISKYHIQVSVLQEFAFGKYKVFKIDSTNNLYFIYARKNDSNYKILSLKEYCSNGISIRVNNEYGFRLHSIFPSQIIGHEIIPNGFVNETKYYGTPVSKEEGYVSNLFISDNIVGLCYVK